jgi:hypothetical protein
MRKGVGTEGGKWGEMRVNQLIYVRVIAFVQSTT